MTGIKLFLVISFIAGISCECVHEWKSISDVNFFRRNAINAGNFKPNTPAFVGKGLNSRDNTVPGRIEVERSSQKLFYSANMKIETTTRDVEYLKQNPEYNYEWVGADSRKCIDNAVTVGDNFFIGRTFEGDFAFIGQVVIGEKVLRYENGQGSQINTGSYEVLTCTVKSQDGNLKVCEANLTSCEANERNLTDINRDLANKQTRLNIELESCKNTRDLYQKNNELLEANLEYLKNDLNVCKLGNPPIDVRSTAPCPDNSLELERLQQQNSALKKKNTDLAAPGVQMQNDLADLQRQLWEALEKNEKLERQLSVGTQGNYGMETIERNLQQEPLKNKILEEQLTNANKEIKSLKDQLASPISCSGVSGCIKALSSVTQFEPDEENQLLQVVRSKLSPDVRG